MLQELQSTSHKRWVLDQVQDNKGCPIPSRQLDRGNSDDHRDVQEYFEKTQKIKDEYGF